MPHFKVRFLKRLLSSDGHSFWCPQAEILVSDVDDNRVAFDIARQRFEQEQHIGHWKLHADACEIHQCGRASRVF
jgi:hypothetical protein